MQHHGLERMSQPDRQHSACGPACAGRASSRLSPAREPGQRRRRRAGGHVGQVMDRVAQQPDRAGEDRQQQLGQAGRAQADRADRNGTIGLPPFVGVVSAVCQRKRRGWVALT